ncbi:MAG: hypothetical protein ACFCUE_14010 [Candidatus Bathyarchaeia archaeon]|jgi:hypothetical protein
MGKISKTFVLFLTMIVALPCLTIDIANAQIIQTPYAPEFTVTYLSNSQYVQPTTSIDPYTGQTINQEGYYNSGEPAIEIKIKNQPFNSVFYQVQTKGAYEENWLSVEYWVKEAPDYSPRNPYQLQDSSSEYTILKYCSLVSQNIPANGKLDIRVKALIGHPIVEQTSDHLDWLNTYASFSFNGTASEWSQIQTLSIPDGKVTIAESTEPTPTPTVPELSSLVILPFFLAVFSVIAVVRYRKTLT